MTIKKYLFSKIATKNLQPKKRKEFKSSLNVVANGSDYEINIKPRGYYVNKSKINLIQGSTQAISFFSGAGGLDIGSQLAGINVISTLDFDKDSVETIKANRYFNHSEHLHSDIRDVTARSYKTLLKKHNPDKLILLGGPPCQPFSKAGYWVTNENRLGANDPRNMINHYLRIVKELKPDGFLLENVESILHPQNAQAVQDLEEEIEKMGFFLLKFRADATEFGVPQRRKRVFFIASRKKIKDVPLKTHGLINQDSLLKNKLLPCERVVDWIAKYDDDAYFEEYEVTKGKTYSTELTEIPPGENYFALTEREGYPNPKFETNKRFWSFLLKLHPLEPSWTISAQPGPWVGPFHWNNRRLRVPEIAAIQTFPSDYIFKGTRRSIQKQIGNAVPPILGKAMVDFLNLNI